MTEHREMRLFAADEAERALKAWEARSPGRCRALPGVAAAGGDHDARDL